MKKRTILKLMLIAMCLCMVRPVDANAMSAKTKTKKAKACYQTFLKKKYTTEVTAWGSPSYDIVDVNGDKVPELLYASYYDWKVYVYYYDAANNLSLIHISSPRDCS